MSHTAPAPTIGDAVRGAALHATLIDVWVTDSATRPSEHGTHIIDPCHAVPPHSPAHTAPLPIWPPTPPTLSAPSRQTTPCFPIAPTTPSPRMSVAPTEPRSVSPASSACH